MEKLLQHTINGAEFDSSDRDPPPRCHPGTRLTIIRRCLDFIHECSGQEKLRWVFGAAGVGKSAVMQIVAEQAPDGVIFASVFLSVNGRRDGTKTIATIAYQLAVRYAPYRQFIQNEIARDPSLPRKSLSVHFQRLIIEPFIHRHIYNPSDRFLVLIDGLDECDNPLTQRELLRLITDFCINHPVSPLVWIVASRPEPHITSFFDDARVTPAYTREEIMIDSDEACEDVQRYLRAELKKIQLEYPTLKRKREWPSELEFTQVTTAAGGLFAYASTVVRYIGDPHFGDPATQLHRVFEVIDTGGKDNILRRDHPMAQLDALYARILSNIPDDVMINTRKLLLLYKTWRSRTFRLQCNLVGLNEGAAYGAVHHLHAVARIPEPDKADTEPLQYFHKSFEDFLFDFNRSGFSANFQHEAEQLQRRMSWRIIEEVPDKSDDMSIARAGIKHSIGVLKGGCESISLSWPGDERFQRTDRELRLELYRGAMYDICSEFNSDSKLCGTMSCFHVLTTRFTSPPNNLPFDELQHSAFVSPILYAVYGAQNSG
ncbi:hypothetical protein AGABI2DRAFT_79996 [Agaricus bisporus var. bisporus H97]|uniref:hypothetical protein n=1 Tax=Agaricus bisporus var. bisporus (strain H97 / ATCC MYA-4626 / FGSC 10389) TaxID=936046 RepID=UPI00029F755C|nr:hypothetical protein AGABI2DRAFT_79996 [Agaricus bisporus var. bisporus H97]EKV41700.1 hypothetical protein AGABI2DRAFT_79996 [Agaricus bisporus var. bisporus H97]